MSYVFLGGIAQVLHFIINFLQILVIAFVIVSFVGDRNNQIVQMINQIVNPLLKPFRFLNRVIPGPLDWSPFVFVLFLIFIDQVFVRYLLMLASSGSAGFPKVGP